MASRKLSAIYDAALAPAGLTLAQYALMRAVKSNQPVSLTDLGRELELERSTVGRNVKVLERLGALALTRGSEDQREAVVMLTESGTTMLEAALPLWQGCQATIRNQLGTGLDETIQALMNVV
ncbi:MarR family winged helix-turn-helix transcriptional regulator [Pseudomonas sp. Pseusp122]|uniref:MarR family winged helix-turn-helix transcriptional regulator n=1 Tax=unclassified Pseudomonas TaxID=196821 RepID=UPI0039A478F7